MKHKTQNLSLLLLSPFTPPFSHDEHHIKWCFKAKKKKEVAQG
jgi:hypothetical protein